MNQNNAVAASLYNAKGQRKYVTPLERQRFIAAAHACNRGELRTLCLVLAYTGVRISEALALTVGSIQIESGFIAVRTLKKRGAIVVREIPVPPDLLIELERRHAISRRQPHERLWTLSRSRAWQLIKALMADCGIKEGPHATPKGLRHGFGVHAIRSGVPVNLVQRWLGHASMTTTAIYLQAIGDEERDIAARMWRDTPTSSHQAFFPPCTLYSRQGDAWSGLSCGPLVCPAFLSGTLRPWDRGT
jgi:integrase